MMIFKKLFQPSAAGLCLLFGFIINTSLFAADAIERGKAKSQQCIACHGEQGQTSNPQFPNLAGQNSAYLEIQLNAFKTGKRNHPVMSPIAKTLSAEDITDLSRYYSNLEPSE